MSLKYETVVIITEKSCGVERLKTQGDCEMEKDFDKGLMFKTLVCGIVGVLAVAIAPILLTRLFDQDLIAAETIGIAVFAEFVGMALGTVLGAKILGAGVTSNRVIATAVLLAIANVITPYGGDVWIVGARSIAGLAGGMLIWVTITTIVKSNAPERWSGIYLSGHTAVQFAAAAILAAVVVPQFGAAGGYAVLAAASLLFLPVARTIPDIRQEEVEQTGESSASYPAVTWLALGSVCLLNGMFSSVISYAEVEFQFRGFAEDITLLIVPVMLGAQILGGLIAAAVAPRLPRGLSALAVSGVLVVTLWQLNQDISQTQLYLWFAVFGFCWLFIGPLHLGFVLAVTGSTQAAELSPAAQLLGLAVGPLIGAALLVTGDFPPVSYHLALIAGSAALLVAALVTQAAPAEAPAVAQRA